MDAREDVDLTQPQTGTIRVLVVGSDAVVEPIAGTLGSADDMEVLVETSGADGLDRLDAEAVDCVVSDDDLSDMDGIEFLQTVRDSHEQIGFVLLLGRGGGTQEAAIPSDLTEYVLKLELLEDEQFHRLTRRIRNVIARRERQQTLARRTERLEQFTSVVSHDLRNPLNVAQSSVELLEADSDHIDRLDRSLSRLHRIIEDVVTLSRQGRTVEKRRAVDLATKVEDAFEAEGATLELTISTGRYLMADPDRLQELLAHLFENAVVHAEGDAVETDEQVTVTVGPLEDGFFVADDGPGIPDGDRDVIFEPGYSTIHTGTGLGLSIVEAIATAHGWDVSVGESDSGGARFEITGVEFR